nr:cytochrome P450 [uncultured Rhodopila sp.]
MREQQAVSNEIATPPGSGGVLARLLSEQAVPAAAARFGAWFGAAFGRPISIAGKVLVLRHDHITEALSRDLDFRIAPINQARIDEVNGPFVLGMDRGATLVSERRALYKALSGVDMAALRAAAAARAGALIDAAGGEIDAAAGYARIVAAGTARTLFGVSGGEDTVFMDAARAIFNQVFLNTTGDKAVEARAVRAAPLLRTWLQSEIERRRSSGELGADMMGMLLRGGQLDDDGVRRTLGGMLVGAIDTTASAVAKIVAVIGRDAALAAKVAADADDEDRLAGWCREALRRWPHNPILLRQAASDTTLAGTPIGKGDQVILWTQAAMLDPSMFPNPAIPRADRPNRAYLHFGGGLHPCAGRIVNDFQIPLLVGALVRRGIRSVGAIDWAGPFPDHIPVTFQR